MSIPLKAIDLSPFTAGQTTSLDITQAAGLGGQGQGLPGQGQATLRLHNESGSGIQCSFNASGQGFNLPAGGWVDCHPRPGDTTLNILILYVLPNPPVTLLLSTYYGIGEKVPAMSILGNSPIGIGGTVNTVGGTATAVQNDGLLAGSTIIEATASGAPSSTVVVGNDGSMKYGVMISGTLFKILQTIANPPAASTEVLLGTGQNGNIVESRDLIQADAGITAPAGSNLSINTDNLHSVLLQNAGSNILAIEGGGPVLMTGAYSFLVGSLSRIVIAGPFTVTSAGTSCPHGLGAVPDFVIPISDVGSFASASTGYGVNFGSMTTTNVTVYSSSAGGVRTWLLSIKK